jgi:hypothetical protein
MGPRSGGFVAACHDARVSETLLSPEPSALRVGRGRASVITVKLRSHLYSSFFTLRLPPPQGRRARRVRGVMYYRLYQTCIKERIYLSIRIELGDVIELVNTLYYFNIMRIRGVSVAAIKYDNNTL